MFYYHNPVLAVVATRDSEETLSLAARIAQAVRDFNGSKIDSSAWKFELFYVEEEPNELVSHMLAAETPAATVVVVLPLSGDELYWCYSQQARRVLTTSYSCFQSREAPIRADKVVRLREGLRAQDIVRQALGGDAEFLVNSQEVT